MTKRSLLLFAVFAGCLQSHPGVQQLAQTDCYSCHKPDYEATPQYAAQDPYVPDHLANPTMYTTQCANCHVTAYWQVHPETAFAIKTGAHQGIQCNMCHSNVTDNAGDHLGANTDCTSCHPSGEALQGGGTMSSGHSEIAAFSYSALPSGFTAQNFCLSCHPMGVEAPHNNTIFPQSHHASTCTDCHDRTIGSDQAGHNALCTRCHRDAHNQSMGVPSGCLQMGCHYGGRGGD